MCRVLYRLFVSLARLAVHSGDSKDLEIIVLRHQLTVGHRQNNRPAIAEKDRAVLGAISAGHCRPCPDRSELAGSSQLDTLLRWHRRRIAATGPNPPDQQAARPPPSRTANSCSQMARENPTWGYRRITRRTHRARPTDWSIDSVENPQTARLRPRPAAGRPLSPMCQAARRCGLAMLWASARSARQMTTESRRLRARMSSLLVLPLTVRRSRKRRAGGWLLAWVRPGLRRPC